MNKIVLTIASLALVDAIPPAKTEDGVLVLNDENFDSELWKFEYLFVDFYTPWCPHCVALAPEWADASKIL